MRVTFLYYENIIHSYNRVLTHIYHHGLLAHHPNFQRIINYLLSKRGTEMSKNFVQVVHTFRYEGRRVQTERKRVCVTSVILLEKYRWQKILQQQITTQQNLLSFYFLIKVEIYFIYKRFYI